LRACKLRLYICACLAVYLFIWILILAFRLAPWLDLGPAPLPVDLAGKLVYYFEPGHRCCPCPACLIQIPSGRTLDSEVPSLAALIRLPVLPSLLEQPAVTAP